MLMRKKALPESLSKPIRLSAASSRGLRMCLGLPPDQSDYVRYVAGEWHKRIEACDKYFGLNHNAANLPRRRIRALFELVYGVPADSQDWECWAYLALLQTHFPGFSFQERGRPKKWTPGALFVLYVDAQKLKTQCPELKGDDFFDAFRARHRRTWGLFTKTTLRKAYAQAKKIARNYPVPPAVVDRKSKYSIGSKKGG